MEHFIAKKIAPDEVDFFLSLGFRRYGKMIYRLRETVHEDIAVLVEPLRIRLSNFEMRKSQRKIYNKNQKLFSYTITPTKITPSEFKLFALHKQRFKENLPPNIVQYLGRAASGDPKPNPVLTVKVFDGEKLIAASYIDVGKTSISSIYGMFHPDYSEFSLGNYTMFLEILYAVAKKMDFYYQGYCYNIPSFYDYKKRFLGVEFLDFSDMIWKPLKQENTNAAQ